MALLAELYASLATITANTPYPKAELEAAWKKVLFNQFHDILPGSSVAEVFKDANNAWGQTMQVSQAILQRSLDTIAQQITLPPLPHPEAQAIVVFNPLNWERSAIVDTSLDLEHIAVETLTKLQENERGHFHEWQLCDVDGRDVESPSAISLIIPTLTTV